MKLVGGDSGRYEHETFVDEVLLAPSERAIVDVRFDTPGSYTARTPDPGPHLHARHRRRDRHRHHIVEHAAFEELRTSDELTSWRARLDDHIARRPDKTLAFKSRMPLLYGDDRHDRSRLHLPDAPRRRLHRAGNVPAVRHEARPCRADLVRVPDAPRRHFGRRTGTCPKCGMRLVPATSANAGRATSTHDEHDHAHAHDTPDGLEWEDLMPEINAGVERAQHDLETRRRRHRQAELGDRLGVPRRGPRQDPARSTTWTRTTRCTTRSTSTAPGRFLIVARDDVVESNLAWKDTVLVRSGETVDILLDVTNPGLWMAHCHIAEHNQAGMMFSFPVRES